QTNEDITIHLGSQLVGSSGFKGNFTSTILSPDGRRQEIKHGATILAIGAQEYRGEEYGYGNNPRILTQQEFERLLVEDRESSEHAAEHLKADLPDTVVMIQCIGPGEKFCSRICCTVALKNALMLKKLKPEADVVVLYKDIRTYGFKERLYETARDRGVIFLRYDEAHRPFVSGEDEKLTVLAWDAVLGRNVQLNPDLLVLSMPIVPNPDVHKLSALFKVPVDTDGFFLEAHVKLRPVDFATDGVFMAGMAHYPKLLDETIIQAQAAASRAGRLLSQETLSAGGVVALVDEGLCTGCLTCVRICPFHVPQIQPNLSGVGNILGAAYIESAICQGCGQCVAECPARAIQLMHYTDAQMIAKVRSLTRPELGFVRLEDVREISE
ncbi:MAG: 4Fe-4S binding protein, partial [Anaerolineales bacterium]